VAHRAALMTTLLFAFSLEVGAQSYPVKPVKIVVPFPPGGSTDVMARNLGSELSKRLGQPFIVENKPGANGNIGSDSVAKAPPDGYTLLLAGVGTNAINQTLYRNMPYDTTRDFAPVTLLATGPNVLVAHPDFPGKTVGDVIAIAKAEAGKLAHGSNGNGSSGHLAMEMLKQAAGIQMVHIPYKGGGPAMADLMGGQIPLLFTNQDAALANVRAGKIRAIAVASAERNPAFPDIPTVAESGLPGFAAVSWFGLVAPAKTPPDIIKRLHAETANVLNEPAFRIKLEQVGFVVVGNTPEQFGAFMKSEVERWGQAVKNSGASVD